MFCQTNLFRIATGDPIALALWDLPAAVNSGDDRTIHKGAHD